MIWTPPELKHHHLEPCDCEPTIAYIRVSMVGNREHMISPDIQLDAIVQDAKLKNKKIVKVVPDIDKSGRTFRRRSIDKVIADIKAGVAKSVTVWKWSRWGRNLEYSLVYLSMTKKAGGRVDSATDDIDQSTATGRFSRDMIMRVDELNSDLIGEGWESAHAVRRENGLPHSGRRRFGYDYVGETGSRKFVKNVDEAPILKALYKKYLAGVSLRKLAKELNDAGLRSTRGGLWTLQALGQMLDTGFAAGFIRERSSELRTEMGDKIRNNLASFDIWRRGTQPPIIDEKTWEKYREKRKAQAALPPRSRSAVHALSTLLFCALCARRMITHYSGRCRQHQWVCSWTQTFHPETSVTIGNAGALLVVRAWVLANTKPRADGESVDELRERILKAANRADRTRAQVNAEIKRWLTKIDRLVDMRTDGEIGKETFLHRKAEYEQHVNDRRSELEELADTVGADGKPGFETFKTLDGLWDEIPPTELNALLQSVVGMVVVSPGASRRTDPCDRLDVVGRWDLESRQRWLAARRVRMPA